MLTLSWNKFYLDEVVLPHGIEVFVKDHDCGDHIEKLYYSCGYQEICIHCGEYLENADNDAETYPQCMDCTNDEIKRR